MSFIKALDSLAYDTGAALGSLVKSESTVIVMITFSDGSKSRWSSVPGHPMNSVRKIMETLLTQKLNGGEVFRSDSRTAIISGTTLLAILDFFYGSKMPDDGKIPNDPESDDWPWEYGSNGKYAKTMGRGI